MLYMYWYNLQNEIVGTMNNNGPWGPVDMVIGDVKSGSRFAAAQFNNGGNLGIYSETPDDNILGMCNDDSVWCRNQVKSKAALPRKVPNQAGVLG